MPFDFERKSRQREPVSQACHSIDFSQLSRWDGGHSGRQEEEGVCNSDPLRVAPLVGRPVPAPVTRIGVHDERFRGSDHGEQMDYARVENGWCRGSDPRLVNKPLCYHHAIKASKLTAIQMRMTSG